MAQALARHDELLRDAIARFQGVVFSTGGDGVAAVFGRVGDAVAAALELQSRLAVEQWPEGAAIRVRVGLHTGEAEERDGDYFGPAVNLAARVMAAGHGGQILLSAATAALAGSAHFVDLGKQALAGFSEPQQVFQLGEGEFPPLRSQEAARSNLPADRSLFVGRQAELDAVAGLVRDGRLVTLTGVGGVGKTRLAVRCAAEMGAEFPGGVWLVELAPLIDSSLVAATVGSALGIPAAPGADPTESVCRFLASRRALLVLDNCEHVIDSAAILVDRLADSARRTGILATSREPLGVAGETVWRVPSLSVDADGAPGDALRLFADRAAAARPGFTLDDSLRNVAAICRRLDGIPLAIELAAARVGTMSIEQIASHLDERFRLLTRGGRTAVARQQTLQGAVDWSYETLTTEERGLFDSLGVFSGSFDMTAVGAVAQLGELEALDLVSQLVDKSMVEIAPDLDRYRLLETLRQYAWERLAASGRLGPARELHAAWCSDLAGQQAALMNTPGRQVEALDRLDLDFDNLRSALAFFIEARDPKSASRLARRLIGLLNIRHPSEGVNWFAQIVTVADNLDPPAMARLLADTAYAAFNAGDRTEQGRFAIEAVQIDADHAPATAYYMLANLAATAGDDRSAVRYGRLAAAAAKAANDRSTELLALGELAVALACTGNGPEAEQVANQSITLARELGNPTLTAVAYQLAGEALFERDRPGDAAALFERALAGVEGAGPAVVAGVKCMYVLVSDDPAAAKRHALDAMSVARQHLSGNLQIQPLLAVSKVLCDAGRVESAAVLLGTHGRFADTFGASRVGPVYQALVTSKLSAQLGADRMDALMGEGAQLDLEAAWQLAERVLAEVDSGV